MKKYFKLVGLFVSYGVCSISFASAPQHILGHWQVDSFATQEVINQRVTNTQTTQKLKQDLLALAGEISLVVRPDHILIKSKTNVINLLSVFSEQQENSYLFEYAYNNNTERLTIELLDKGVARISAPLFLGLDWYRWKKQQKKTEEQ